MPFPEYWGHMPVEMPLVLVRGQDFRQEMTLDPGDELPAGTLSRIELTKKGQTVATIEGIVSPEKVEFSEESEVTDLYPAGLSYYWYVVYPETPDHDFCVTYGSVERI